MNIEDFMKVPVGYGLQFGNMSFVDNYFYAFVSTAMETRSKSHRRLIGDCFEW